jgi:tRNA nucleotidyltransferase (CCA-adding enzyme)
MNQRGCKSFNLPIHIKNVRLCKDVKSGVPPAERQQKGTDLKIAGYLQVNLLLIDYGVFQKMLRIFLENSLFHSFFHNRLKTIVLSKKTV